MPEGRQLAVDPRGRFVYVAGGHLGSSVGYYLRSYAVATATGRLDHRSNAPVSVTWPATSLAANERQIYVLGAAPYTGNHGGWSVFDVDLASGSLTRAPNPPLRWEPDLVVRDLESRFVYSAAVERIDCFYCSRLFVSALRADGTLQDVGGMTIDPESGPVVRGTAAVAGPGLLLVADTRGRITSYAVDGTTGSLTLLARLDPAFAGGAARLALARRAGEQLLALGGTTELRVYAVGPSGSLTLRDEMVLTSSARARSVAFHPSGRFLYASGEGEGVRVFAVAEDGRLQDIGREARGGGPLVVIGR